MFPRVYQTLTANATVVAMVGDRIGRHGVIQQSICTVVKSPHGVLLRLSYGWPSTIWHVM